MAACGAAAEEKKEVSSNPSAIFRILINADVKALLEAKGVKDISENDFIELKAELYLDTMPYTVSNFIDLANNKFYDGIHFHRIIPNFMLQFGCPNAKNPNAVNCGQGNPPPNSKFKILGGPNAGKEAIRSITGCIDDELTQQISNEPLTLSMANTGRQNSGGSQFFMNTVHNKYLDWFDNTTASQHPVFGKLDDSAKDYLKIIENVTTEDNDRPKYPLKMKEVIIDGI